MGDKSPWDAKLSPVAAGGAILLLALKTLQEFKKDFVPKLEARSGTHPATDARINYIATTMDVGDGEIERFKTFVLAAVRIIDLCPCGND